MFDVKSVDEALTIIENNFKDYKLDYELTSIDEANERILCQDIISEEDIPSFNRSTVDGYAVIASDTFGVSDAIPAQLNIIGEIKMGEKPSFVLKQGETCYIPTGGELPSNADGIVMIEYTENFDDGDVFISKACSPGNNVVYKGDDVVIGAKVIGSGTLLKPQDIGLLAALGYSEVKVKKKLRVGIISTGDEIIGISEKPIGSQVRDVNSYSLYAIVQTSFTTPVFYGIVPDDYNTLKEVVEKATVECDIVLISGGSSVGQKDVTSDVIDSLGYPGVLVHGIAVKPGKPTIIGKIGEKAVVGLPGHPASAFVVCNIFITHLINTMLGISKRSIPKVNGEMASNYPSNTGREEYLPVRVEKEHDRTIIYPVYGKSSLISILSKSNGYIHISRGSEGLNKGQLKEVVLWK
ncbi:molybdopterin molybdenumtransferase MoeA [Alkalibaculum sp. M08DMB]|uniref:Molybdopterin molybdenumtransferase n=1 Tax=Alkalibaculum sporogenes TaxID=2655001 RepID=A0A6A7KBE3_9FIRM|nr:gephyrin-like molybdotransferase Glp [Alkalibaculum sporogenes]MPW26665.1 molybdopterin molybdenumtransferase MoeA [Alkalibaculum sporogenes]